MINRKKILKKIAEWEAVAKRYRKEYLYELDHNAYLKYLQARKNAAILRNML